MARPKNNLTSLALTLASPFSASAAAAARWERAQLSLEHGNEEPLIDLIDKQGISEANAARSYTMRDAKLLQGATNTSIGTSGQFHSLSAGSALDFAIACDRHDWCKQLLDLGGKLAEQPHITRDETLREAFELSMVSGSVKCAAQLARTAPNLLSGIIHREKSATGHPTAPLPEAIARGHYRLAEVMVDIMVARALDNPVHIPHTQEVLHAASSAYLTRTSFRESMTRTQADLSPSGIAIQQAIEKLATLADSLAEVDVVARAAAQSNDPTYQSLPFPSSTPVDDMDSSVHTPNEFAKHPRFPFATSQKAIDKLARLAHTMAVVDGAAQSNDLTSQLFAFPSSTPGDDIDSSVHSLKDFAKLALSQIESLRRRVEFLEERLTESERRSPAPKKGFLGLGVTTERPIRTQPVKPR